MIDYAEGSEENGCAGYRRGHPGRGRKTHARSQAVREAQRRTDAAVKADSFEWNRSSSTVDGLVIHYFRTKDESVTGILCPEERELWKGFTYKFACDRLDVPLRPPEIFDPPQLIRLPGNRLLAKAIADADCQVHAGQNHLSRQAIQNVPALRKSLPRRVGPGCGESPGIDETGRCQGCKAAAEAATGKGKSSPATR